MFTKVMKCKPDIIPLNVFWSNLWKEAVSYRKQYEIVTWNCHLHSYKRKSHLYNCNRKSHVHITCIIGTETPICIIPIKIITHIFVAEAVSCICAAETSNCIIATETVTCTIVTEIHFKQCSQKLVPFLLQVILITRKAHISYCQTFPCFCKCHSLNAYQPPH